VSAQPILRVDVAHVITNSRDVAEFFGKRHDNVLDTIDRLIVQAPEINGLIFEAVEYLDEKDERRCFGMDRDGFTLLAMGFTGPKALEFKLAYITRFNEMESAIKSGGIKSYDEFLGAMDRLLVPLAVRLETQDSSIGRIEKRVDGIAETVSR
jgi:anti-repressor protein